MVDKDQEIKKPNNHTFNSITKSVRWILYTILFAIFMIPISFLTYIYVYSESKVTEISILKSFVEESLEQQLIKYNITVSSAGVTKGNNFFSPKFVFHDIKISNNNGERLFNLPKVYTNLDILFSNDKSIVSVEDAQLFLRRNQSGKFSVASNDLSKTNLLEKIDLSTTSFDKSPFTGRINQLKVENISIAYQDDKTQNTYFFENGNFNIIKNLNELSVSSVFELIKNNDEKAVFYASVNHTIHDEIFTVKFKVDNADPLILANQIPALNWLRNVDTNVNASIITSIDSGAKILDMNGMIELEAGKLKATPKYSSTEFLNLKTYFAYDFNLDILDFSSFEFKSKQLSATGSAKNILMRDPENNISGSNTDLKITEIKVNRPDIFNKENILLKSGHAELIIILDPLNITINNSKVKSNETNLSIIGKIIAKNNYWESNLNLEIDTLDKQQIVDFWPISYNAIARKWFLENINSTIVSSIKGNVISSNGKRDLDIIFDFNDTNINAIKTVVPLIEISGEGSLSAEQITFNLKNGKFETSKKGFTDLSGSIFHIPNTKEKPARGQMKLNAQGNIKSFFEILDSEKFKYLTKAGFSTDLASGNAQLAGWIEWPLIKGVSQDQVLFEIDGTLSNIKSDKIIKGRLFESENLNLIASHKSLSIDGKSKINNFPLKFLWNQNLKDNSEKISFVAAEFNIDENGLEAFNISLPDGMFKGISKADLKLTLKPKYPTEFIVKSNLNGSEININSLGWSNKNVKNGDLIIRGSLSKPVDVDEIKISADDLSASGKINFENDGQFKSAVFPVLEVSDWFSTSLTLSKTDNVNLMELEGGKVDFRSLVFGKSEKTEVGFLKVSLDSLRISDGIEFTNFIADIDFSKKELGSFKAQVNGGADIYGKLSKGEFGTIITLDSANAGHVLRSSGILKNIRGGGINLVLTPNEKKGYYTGRFIINKFRMLHSNPLALLLDSLSLVGLVDKLENEGIQFNQAKGWLNITPEGIQLSDVSLVGLSMGMSITGWYDKKKKAINFDGVVTPVYAINGVFERLAGKLFGEQKGEGLFSFVYTMKGPTSAPIVEVKPLSILTPGGFRKIFRSDIPAPEK
ncbi:AsmA-like C-terminal region-containing protein [Amylibacter sp.]|nr:AsmA-like C-terminal region-containing protein [Amylibacter sp.]